MPASISAIATTDMMVPFLFIFALGEQAARICKVKHIFQINKQMMEWQPDRVPKPGKMAPEISTEPVDNFLWKILENCG
jgi:hypothetical protein